jgi:hypothetical protein
MSQHAPIPLDTLIGLYAVATGQLTHVNNGSCPDILEGAVVRDDECPACQMLLAADAQLRDAQLRDAGVSLPDFVAPATPDN